MSGLHRLPQVSPSILCTPTWLPLEALLRCSWTPCLWQVKRKTHLSPSSALLIDSSWSLYPLKNPYLADTSISSKLEGGVASKWTA